jgi:hypothetical protein
MGKIYYKAFNVQQALEGLIEEDAPRQFRVTAMAAFRKRWDMMYNDLHGAGYCLDPEFLDVSITELPEPMCGLDQTIERLSKTPEDAAKASEQFLTFRDQKGAFASSIAKDAAKVMPAHKWWERYGYFCPELQYVARRVLAQVVSATACERNWSVFGYLHTAVRNKLSAEKSADLTYCYSSLRLRDKLDDVEHDETVPEWDEQIEMC